MRATPLLSALACCLFLAGCAARATQEPASQAAPMTFCDTVAAQPEGVEQDYPESPLGHVSIESGPLYLSGLGNECRPLRVTRGNVSQRFALCKADTVGWHFVPPIFESLPR